VTLSTVCMSALVERKLVGTLHFVELDGTQAITQVESAPTKLEMHVNFALLDFDCLHGRRVPYETHRNLGVQILLHTLSR